MRILFVFFIVLLPSCKTLDTINSKLISMERLPQKEFRDPTSNGNLTIKPHFPINTLKIVNQYGRIKINGRSYTDKSGEITQIVQQSDTGYITYITPTEINNAVNYIVKLDKPFKSFSNKEIARFNKIGTKYFFKTPNNQNRTALNFQLTSQGIILYHQGGFFSYITENHASDLHEIPEGFSILPSQSTDISKSGYIGFMKNKGLYTVGITSQPSFSVYEVIFIDIDTGKIRASELLKVEKTNSSRNIEGFNQVLQLVNSNDGFYMFNLQTNYQNIFARNLNSGVKKSIISRENGISKFQSGIDESGKVWVKSTYGLKEEKFISDVTSMLTK